jgi:hypothetical protein
MFVTPIILKLLTLQEMSFSCRMASMFYITFLTFIFSVLRITLKLMHWSEQVDKSEQCQCITCALVFPYTNATNKQPEVRRNQFPSLIVDGRMGNLGVLRHSQVLTTFGLKTVKQKMKTQNFYK